MSNTLVSFTQAKQRRAVERAAELQSIISTASRELDDIKALFRGLGDGEYLGKTNKIVVVTSSAARLDQAAVKARLLPKDYLECVVVNESTRVLIKHV
jgi:hypothetical protein